MAGSRRYSTTKTRRVRLTREDVCGVPIIGARSTLVTGGFVKVETKHDYTDGKKFELQTAWGDYEVDEVDDPVYRGADVNIDYTAVDPDAWELSAGSRTLVAGADDDFASVGESIGFAIGKHIVPGNYMLEAWTKPANGACNDGTPVWIYTAWSWIHAGKVGDQVLELGTATFPMTGRAQGPAAALDNPYDEGLPSFVAGEAFLQTQTLIQPPAITNGLVALVAL